MVRLHFGFLQNPADLQVRLTGEAKFRTEVFSHSGSPALSLGPITSGLDTMGTRERTGDPFPTGNSLDINYECWI